jgi:hypothetical protein
MIAVPAFRMMAFTSAKSVLISPGHGDEVGHAANGREQDVVGDLEGVEHRGVGRGDREQSVVGDDDERVDLLTQRLDPLLGLGRASLALEGKWPRDHANRQDAQPARDLGDDGRRAGPGATTLAGGDEDHVGLHECLFDLGAMVLGGLSPDLGVAPGAETLGQLATDVEFQVGLTHQEGLGVGIGRDEFDVAKSRGDHSIDCVHSAPTNADDFDHGVVIVLIETHELPLG